MSTSCSVYRLVIVGGGFGGLYCARAIRRRSLAVTLLDRRNFHLFQPLLYQVATGALSPANVAAPLRSLLHRGRQTEVLLAEVVDFDVPARKVVLADGEVSYDSLVVAAGSQFNYFGHDAWRPLAPGLKSIEDATTIRARLLTAFEMAERANDPAARRRWLTFVIVGGGATGVELAGALAELSRHTLRHDFRSIDSADARILLVEGRQRLLEAFPEELSYRTLRTLERLGVTVGTDTVVTDVQPGAVTIQHDERGEVVSAGSILWTAGVRTAPIAERLAAATGAATDRMDSANGLLPPRRARAQNGTMSDSGQPLSDQQLMRQAQAGDRAAFAEIVRRYRPALLRVAQSRLGRHDWAEDAVQETLLAAFQWRGSYRPTNNFRTWLWTILLNQCRRSWTGRLRRPRLYGFDDRPAADVEPAIYQASVDRGEAPPWQRLLVQERSEFLESLLKDLPAAQADALRLRFFAGLKFDEIAETMQCSLGTAKNRVKWGLMRLAESVRQAEQGSADPKSARRTAEGP